MKQQYAVIGLGRFGYSVAETLAEMDAEILAIDIKDDAVKAVSDFITHAVVLDATDEKALRSVGIQNIDIVIVSIGENLEASILVVMLLKELGVHYIIAKAATSLHGRVLDHLKVDRIIYPERDMATRVARSLTRPAIIDQLELSADYSIIELPTPSVLQGKLLKDTQMRTKYGANLIAIKRVDKKEGEEREMWNINPLPTDILHKDDLLVLIGLRLDLERLSKL